MDIITLGNLLANFESRLQTLENSLSASIESVKLETNAIMNAVDNAATAHIQELQAQVDLVRTLRGVEPAYAPGSVVELRANNK